ncbi:hypothetical protein J6590_095782 [Homalodisca vitripennis]|nr:hypothetical protein J6590_095782 [Homalodisca vitripennis]
MKHSYDLINYPKSPDQSTEYEVRWDVCRVLYGAFYRVCLRRRLSPVPTPLETIPLPRRQICGRPLCEESDSSFSEYEDKDEFQQQQPGSYDFRTILPHEDFSREVVHTISEESIHHRNRNHQPN